MIYVKNDLIKYIFEEKLSYEKIGEIYNVSGSAQKIKMVLVVIIGIIVIRLINKYNMGKVKYKPYPPL
jgi:hypothetical protein